MALANRGLTVPNEWQARQVTVDGTTDVTTGPLIQASPETKQERELLEQFGYDPEQFRIVGSINQWRKEKSDGQWLTSYFFKVEPIEARLDLPALYAAAAKKPRKAVAPSASGRTTVVCLADFQVGKTGSRGGTPELLERLAALRVKVEAELKRRKPEAIFIPDVGDTVESFENVASQAFLNDLSFPQQIDMAATEIYEFIKLCARFGPVTVAAVGSNHSAWRRGKDVLGRPGVDDWGIVIHKQVAKICREVGLDVTWTFPADYDETLVVDVRGTGVGLAHGDQFQPRRAPEWWAKQVHGGQPLAAADILLTGHYHHLLLEPSGRNPYTGRQKWHVQLPTVDNGSDWFRARAGEDSDAAMVVFDITDDGFDIGSLALLKAD